jgi:hypothetical protein
MSRENVEAKKKKKKKVALFLVKYLRRKQCETRREIHLQSDQKSGPVNHSQ